MNFTEHQVEQYEMFAEIIKDFDYVNDNIETKFLIFLLNIESLLPKSNIFEYVFKTDINKDVKLDLQENKKQKFDIINNNVELLKSLPIDIENKWNEIKNIELSIKDIHKQMDEIASENNAVYTQIDTINTELSNIDNEIEESEWRINIDSHEEFIFNKIKEKLIIEKKLNYGSI